MALNFIVESAASEPAEEKPEKIPLLLPLVALVD
jgi:hypothetical protein